MKRYYTASVGCRASDYYLDAGEPPGRWHGRGLAGLGLAAGSVVSERQLEALFARALHPVTGRRLGRAWRADGVTGYDLTFSAPKSVSAVWALGDPGLASAAVAAHRAAVKVGLGYLELHASSSRRGTDGVEQVASQGMAVALFDHRTSRCGDPQLHTHALVVNKVRCADGVWRTLDGTELFHHKKSAGMIYQAALRNEIGARLGIEFGPVNEHGQAEIAAIPGALLKTWSKRTASIMEEAGPKIAEFESTLARPLAAGERAAVVKTAVIKTRPNKQHTAGSSLRETWVREAAAVGVTWDGLRRTLTPSKRRVAGRGHDTPEPMQAGQAALLSEAVTAAGRAKAVFSRADVAGQIAARLPATSLAAAATLAQVEALTEAALALPAAVGVGELRHGLTPRASDRRWASQELLAAEGRILSLADRGRGGGYGQAPPTPLAATQARLDQLDASQIAAVAALTTSGDFLSVLTAPAGAGKTYTLATATAVWEGAGYRVVGLAPSARAAAELAAATGGRSDTLAKWLFEQDRASGRPWDRQAWTRVDDRTVLLVDEASMASTFDLDRLTTIAAWRAAKVVLVGDPSRIGVVHGPGGLLEALTRDGHGVALSTVHRFHQPWERETTLRLRDGDPGCLTDYQQAGRLHPCPDGDTAVDAVHSHWARERAAGRDALMMARTRADVDALNLRARSYAVAVGQVRGPVASLGGRDWQAGDVLRTRRNDRRLPVGDSHVRNGDRYTVLAVDGPDGGLIVEHLDTGRRALLPAGYAAAHAEYGWASTIDGAQGATCDVGVLLVRPGIDREHLYVGMTRGRDANHAYVTPDTTTEADHHVLPPPGRPHDLTEATLQVLRTAVASSGAQRAAHTLHADTLRAAARPHAVAEQKLADRRAIEQAREDERRAVTAVPAEHAATRRLHDLRSAELAGYQARRTDGWRDLREARHELAGLSRWSRTRRHELTTLITDLEQLVTAAPPDDLIEEVGRLGRQVADDTTEHQSHVGHWKHRRLGDQMFERAPGELTRPRPAVVRPDAPHSPWNTPRSSARPVPQTRTCDDRDFGR